MISHSRNVILAFVALLEYVKREMGEGEQVEVDVLIELAEAINSSIQELFQTAYDLSKKQNCIYIPNAILEWLGGRRKGRVEK